MMGANDGFQQHQDHSRFIYELEIVQRIKRGIATLEDADYVGRVGFGFTTKDMEITKEIENEMAR